MPENNTMITINGEEYRFCNQIGNEPGLFNSFNELAKYTFGIQFDSVGGEYEPHVLAKGDTVCANVSVNQIFFSDKGRRRLYVQLGTVMTKKEYRKRGLSRWLMEQIISKWQGECDAVYLFANDSVLDFYPKFGFEVQKEFEYVYQNGKHTDFHWDKLCMSDSHNVELVLKKYKEGNPFSAFSMVENRAIFDFYAKGIWKDAVYYSEEVDMIAFVEFLPDAAYCRDLFGNTSAHRDAVLGSLGKGGHNTVILGFTPECKHNLLCREYEEPDTTLFLLRGSENKFKTEKGMFPVLSHA